MNIFNLFKKKRTRAASPGATSDYRYWANEYQSELTPSKWELAEQFRGIASMCATINAQSVANATYRVYDGDDEIDDHPLLDLLNDNSIGSPYDLLELTQLYLEMYGEAFWYIPRGGLGIPSQIILLDATEVQKIVSDSKLVGFRYSAAGKSSTYSVEDLLWFRYSNITNPYISTTCPAKQAWMSIRINSTYESMELAICTNSGRPDLMVVTPDPLGPEERLRLESQYNVKFGRQGQGKVIVLPATDGEVKPINYSPKDLASMKISDWARGIIAGNFQIPVPILDSRASNRAQIEGAFYQYAILGVEPRVKKMSYMLTKLVQLYDPMLKVKADSVVSRDEARDATIFTSYTTAGILTVNEVRREIGYEPVPGGDELMTKPSVQTVEENTNADTE